jgi:prevent-host-death family protein
VEKVQIAILKNHLSRYLAAVRDGAEIVVLDRHTPVARIVPYGPRIDAPAGRRADDWSAARLADLARRGAVRPARRGGLAKWLESRRPVRLPAGAPGVVDALIRERRESSR